MTSLLSVLTWDPFPYPRMTGLPRTVRWGAAVANLAVIGIALWIALQIGGIIALVVALAISFIAAPLAATAVTKAYPPRRGTGS
jgi:multisubunit Na+/H+ antiporter MnhG subunit